MSSSLVNYFLFKPPKSVPYRIPTEVLRLRTSRGSKIAIACIDRPGSDLTLIYSHGNAEDLNTSYNFMLKLSVLLGVNVVGYDYSGYGESSGTPSEADCYADIDAVFKYLTINKRVPPEKIVVFGRSLGSGPSCYLAGKTAARGRSVAALILLSPFTSVFRVAMDRVSLPRLDITILGDLFPNIDRIPETKCPVFIAHGKEDDIVPFEHGRALFDVVPNKMKAQFCTMKGVKHNRMDWFSEMELFDSLSDFLDFYLLADLYGKHLA